ncbi:MAG: hypothetical protein AAF702_51960 [Chloroflexota bacterium]
MKKLQIDYDGAWKEALDIYFDQFMAFFFPEAHAKIDWGFSYEHLDKELQQVTRDADLGKQRVDKLIKVWLNAETEVWVLVHVEVQTQHEIEFAERMYVYNYRLYDRFHRRVASMAILGDMREKWKPTKFSYDLVTG